jgi:hypothetical protein
MSNIALRQGRIDFALDLARLAITANFSGAQSHNHERACCSPPAIMPGRTLL